MIELNLLGVLEGILFAVGDDGISLESICDVLNISEKKAKELLSNLQKRYDSDEYGIRISYIGNSFKLTTKKEHKDYYKKLLGDAKTNTLSDVSLEVLAIIAYNQPISRSIVDNIRGVASSYVIRKLEALGFIKVVGKSSMPGKPNLYGTTDAFLDYFGLASIEDLPKIDIKEEEKPKEEELFTSIYKEG